MILDLVNRTNRKFAFQWRKGKNEQLITIPRGVYPESVSRSSHGQQHYPALVGPRPCASISRTGLTVSLLRQFLFLFFSQQDLLVFSALIVTDLLIIPDFVLKLPDSPIPTCFPRAGMCVIRPSLKDRANY